MDSNDKMDGKNSKMMVCYLAYLFDLASDLVGATLAESWLWVLKFGCGGLGLYLLAGTPHFLISLPWGPLFAIKYLHQFILSSAKFCTGYF